MHRSSSLQVLWGLHRRTNVACIHDHSLSLPHAVLFNWQAALSALPGIVAAALDGSIPTDEQWLQAIEQWRSTTGKAEARRSLEAAKASRRQTALIKVCKLIIGHAFVMLGLDSIHISYGAAIMWASWFKLTTLAFTAARWSHRASSRAGNCLILSPRLSSPRRRLRQSCLPRLRAPLESL